MLIANNLICKVFIVMFLCLFIFEVVTIVSFICLNQIPLNKNVDNIIDISQTNSNEIAQSFSQLISGKFTNIRTDLMLFVKHTDILYLQTNAGMPIINKNSKFYHSFQNCIYKKANYPEFHHEFPKFLKSEYMELLYKETKDNMVKKLISDQSMSNILNHGYLFEPSEINIDNFFLCYALSFLKTIVIKNIVFDTINQTTLNYTMLIGNNILFYPSYKLEFKQIIQLPYYDTNNSQCNFNYSFECLGDKTDTHPNSIYAYSPILKHKSIITNVCIPFRYIDNTITKNALCATVNISQIISNITIDSQNIMLNLVKKEPSNDIELLYSSDINISNITEVFKDSKFKAYQIKSSNNKLKPFHALYYNVSKHNNLSEDQLTLIIKEYEDNLIKINEKIDELSDITKRNIESNISVTQTAMRYSTQNDSGIFQSSSLRSDLFNYHVYRIELSNSKFKNDGGAIVFDEESKEILMYLIVVVKIGDSVFSNQVYTIFALKAFKSLIRATALNFLGAILFFVFFQWAITIIFYPLISFRSVISSISDRKKQIERQVLGHISKDEKEVPRFDEKTLEEEYTNKEIQSIGNVIISLNKIINLKDPKTTYKQKAELYSSIGDSIVKDTIENFKSQIIIAKYYIKEQDKIHSDNTDNFYINSNANNTTEKETSGIAITGININETEDTREFQKAIDALDSIQKAFIEKEAFIANKSIKTNEQSNIECFQGLYINEFNQEKYNKDNEWVSFQFIKQHYYFIYGLAYYYSFRSLHKKNKKAKEEERLQQEEEKNRREVEKAQQEAEKVIEETEKAKIDGINQEDINLKSSEESDIIITEDTKGNKDKDKKKENIDKEHLENKNKFAYNEQYENTKMMYLSQAIRYFKISHHTNAHLKCNSIKNIMILLYLSKCYYYYQTENQKTDASKMLKKAIVSLMDFFNRIKVLTKESTSPKFTVDPKIMLLISGILMEDILFLIGKFARKLNKDKSTFEFLTKMFSISYFKNQFIHHKAIKTLKNIMEKNKLETNIIYKQLSKLQGRIGDNAKQKVVFIVITQNFIESLPSFESFKLLLKNCLEKYLREKDLISFMYLKRDKDKIPVKNYKRMNTMKVELGSIPLKPKQTALDNIDIFLTYLSAEELSSSKENINLVDAFVTIEKELLDMDNGRNIEVDMKEMKRKEIDLYVFSFGKLKDVRSSDKNSIKNTIKINHLKVRNASFYAYCLDKEIKRVEHYKKFLSNLSEGIILRVKNFKMIKLGFENIANLDKHTNILSIDFSNTDNLLY